MKNATHKHRQSPGYGTRSLLFAFTLLCALAVDAIQVIPPRPTTADEVTIRVVGDWDNSCAPTTASYQRNGNNITVRLLPDVSAEEMCWSAITPFEVAVSAGRLPSGCYTIKAVRVINGAAEDVATTMFCVSGAGNSAPTVSDLVVPAMIPVGETFTIQYRYDDPDGLTDVKEHHILSDSGDHYVIDAWGSGIFYKPFRAATPGAWTIEAYVVDRQGQKSNSLLADTFVHHPPPKLTASPARAACGEPVTIRLNHTDGRWDLFIDGRLAQTSIALQSEYRFTPECERPVRFELRLPEDHGIRSNELIVARDARAPRLTLIPSDWPVTPTEDDPDPVQVLHLTCNQEARIELSHQMGQWDVWINGQPPTSDSFWHDFRPELDVYSLTACDEKLEIQFKDPDDSDNVSNRVKIIWDAERLLNTYWDQYPINYDIDNDGKNETYVAGCGSVAVAQIINYYFQHGYRSGWLESLFDEMEVNPIIKSEGKELEYPLNNLNFTTQASYIRFHNNDGYDIDSKPDFEGDWGGTNTYNEYTPDQFLDLRTFLTAVALGLDSKFYNYKNYTGSGEVRYIWLLIDKFDFLNIWGDDAAISKVTEYFVQRFKFNMTINETAESTETIGKNKNFIKWSLDKKAPIFLMMYDGTEGHFAIIDAYRDKDGVFEVRINFGWGIKGWGDHTFKWWAADQPISIDTGTAQKLEFDKFYMFAPVPPCNKACSCNETCGNEEPEAPCSCLSNP